MRRHWNGKGKVGKAWAIGLALLCGACSTAPVQPHPATHVVLMWLNHPESAAERAQLIRAAHSLRMMPGVVRVDTGRTLPPASPLVDRSFDLAVLITFRDRAALERFEGDARPRAMMERYLRPLVRRYEVFNIGVR